MSNEDDRPYPPSMHVGQRGAALAYGIFAPPIAWLLHLVASYAIVEPMCGMSHAWLVHTAMTAVALLIAIPGGVLAYRSMHTEEGSGARSRLLPTIALANSVLFSLIMILSWTAALVVPPCTP